MKATPVDPLAGRTGRAAALLLAMGGVLAVPSGAQESSAVAGHLELELELEVEHSSTRVTCEHGNEVGLGALEAPEKGETARLQWHAAWEDTNRVLFGSRLMRFDRTYGDLKLDLDRGGARGSLSLVSPLEGLPHRWSRNQDGPGYACSVLSDPEEATARVLATLESDLSFSWVLPANGFSQPGQVWHPETGDLIESLWPGGFGPAGHLGYDVSDGEYPSELMIHVALVPSITPDALFWSGTIDGDVRAELQALEAERVAVIALQFHTYTSIAIEDWFGALLHGEKDFPTDLPYSGEGLRVALRGSGTVRWSIERKLLISVELSGEVEMDASLQWSYSWDAPQIEEFFGERSETWRGHFELAGAAERRE